MLFVFWQCVIIMLMCKRTLPSQIFTLYLKDKLLSGFNNASTVIGRIRCVNSCSIDAACYGVAYHEFRHMCYFYNNSPVYLNSIEDIGMVTFLPKGTFIKNIALNKPVNVSSVYPLYGPFPPCKGVDGDWEAVYGELEGLVHTMNSDREWWCVDLEKIYNFQSVVLYNRYTTQNFMDRLREFELRFSHNGHCNLETFNGSTLCYKDTESSGILVYNITSCNQPAANFSSRYIFINPRPNTYLTFKELVVWELKY